MDSDSVIFESRHSEYLVYKTNMQTLDWLQFKESLDLDLFIKCKSKVYIPLGPEMNTQTHIRMVKRINPNPAGTSPIVMVQQSKGINTVKWELYAFSNPSKPFESVWFQ